MKVLQINTVYNRSSTGKIAKGIHDVCKEYGIECISAYRYLEDKKNQEDTLTVSSWLDCHIHNRLVRYTKMQGCFSKIKTRKFIRKVKRYNPDIIHLHNIHGSYINFGVLFNFIKRSEIKVIWTLHDCWSFTGQCPYFDVVKCDKWKTECNECPQYKGLMYPIRKMFKNKKKWYSDLNDMTIVTPSAWLKDLVKQSFLKDYPVKVINNGIDLSIFRPTESDFRKKYSIGSKKMILGVAFDWGYRKGLDVFVELANRLDKNEYQIVLVGTNDEIDKWLPLNIISIHRTNNQVELAEIYTAADLFVNPTREENYPTVNMESIACGTPVLTFNTGGSPEMLDDLCGSVVPVDDVDEMEAEIVRICTSQVFSSDDCLSKSTEYDMNDRFKEYIELYENSTYST